MTFEATRKKQNLVLVPRGKALYEDESSFGSRMLKSMGWEKGKGLGKEQHGNVDFIQIRYKQDANGLGFEKLKDNQWTQHEDTFNSLLKSLNNENNSNSAGEEENVAETLKNRKSLESLSKNSKSRVHYKRYTRGKDISRYSEKDLANIFGKKSLTEEKEIVIEPIVVEEEEPDKAYESNSIVNTGVSVNDYFKILMAKKQNKNLSEETNSDVVNELPEIKKNKKKSNFGMPEEIIETLEEESVMPEEPKKKKCKKSKRVEEPEELVIEDELQVVKVKKTKKKHQEDPVFVEAAEEYVDEEPQKKKKKKKSKDVDVEDATLAVDTIVEAELPSKKKSKKRKADEMTAETTEPSTPSPDLPIMNPVTLFNGKNSVYSTNVIQINTTVAQKLASLTVDQFTNSNISNIVGYGLTEEIELKTVQTKMVEDRGKLDKYSLYNMVSSRDKINKKKLFSKLKRPKNSFQVL